MTDKEIIKEFTRWINADRPKVWYKDGEQGWTTASAPNWGNKDVYFIVNDEQAEIRRHLVDNPDTKFEIKILDRWRDAEPEELWLTNHEYRVKPELKVERRWRYAKDADECTITSHAYVTDSHAKDSRYPESGWYKLDDYIDVEVEA
jgi:hypothetical protein